jgi:hypothetical protein
MPLHPRIQRAVINPAPHALRQTLLTAPASPCLPKPFMIKNNPSVLHGYPQSCPSTVPTHNPIVLNGCDTRSVERIIVFSVYLSYETDLYHKEK